MDSALIWDDVVAVSGDREGAFDAPCPACGPDRRSGLNQVRKVLRIWRSEPDFATYHCARCSASGWVKPDTEAESRRRGVLWNAIFPRASDEERKAAQEAEAADRRRRSAFAEFVWCSANPIEGTLAEAYLASRGYGVGELDADCLRFASAAPFSYEGDRSCPGMVAPVRNVTGEIIGCHVTFLNPDGLALRKPDGGRWRAMFGRVAGGAIRLAGVGTDGVLAVAEGIETALAFRRLYGVPAWAALSASGVAQFMPPQGLSRLVVAPDHDASGRGLQAAQRLAERARVFCPVVIQMPGKAGLDWDDVRRETAA